MSQNNATSPASVAADAEATRKRKSDQPVESMEAEVHQQQQQPDSTGDNEEAMEESWKPCAADVALVLAADRGDSDEVKRLIDTEGADPCYQDFDSGMSVLMAAAAAGSVETVRVLLQAGAPWNAVDRKYHCAGEYAMWKGHQVVVDELLSHAAASELLLASLMSKDRVLEVTGLQREYMRNRVSYTGTDLLLDSEGLAVMMAWEQPLMRDHAAFIVGDTSSDGTVLNIGFGMGLVDTELQKLSPKHHTIVEAHPDVLQRMRNDGWMEKPNVTVVAGRWQEVVDKLGQFDGVFFDTYAEDDLDLHSFHQKLPQLLRKPQGRYSFYNGMCPDNVFFHAVACEVVRLRLRRLGLDCSYTPVPVSIDDEKVWRGVRDRYWHFDTYYLPCITWL